MIGTVCLIYFECNIYVGTFLHTVLGLKSPGKMVVIDQTKAEPANNKTRPPFRRGRSDKVPDHFLIPRVPPAPSVSMSTWFRLKPFFPLQPGFPNMMPRRPRWFIPPEEVG